MNNAPEADLLILGAGAAGMTVALVAALEGLKPVLIEKSAQVGGTAATSAGTIWIPGNRQSLEAGLRDSASAAQTYLDALIAAPDAAGLRRAFLETGPKAIEYLRERTEVQFTPSGKHPDYRDLNGAAVAGRTLAPTSFDGRQLGKDFERVRPPIAEFMILGGMMAGKHDIPKLIGRFSSLENFWYSGKLFARYWLDRWQYSRGTRVVMGNALVARLYFSLKKLQVPILFQASASELLREGDRIVGARIDYAGQSLSIEAARGVVLATGGFGHNPRLRGLLMRSSATPPPHSLSAPTNTGDGIELGQRYGARLDLPQLDLPGAEEVAFWTPVSLTRRADGSRGLYPHLSLDRAKPGLIAVNGAAQRFVNEADSYHDFVLAQYRSHRQVPSLPAYLICEAAFVRRYGLGNIHPGTRNLQCFVSDGYIAMAPTIEALAGEIGLDGRALRSTIERFNQFARSGRDADFGKGESELNRFNGDPAVEPNPCLGELKQAPFVALAVWPADIGTSRGLSTDIDGRVLDGNGRPMGGLYACGNDMNSVMAGTYPGPGTTLGPALTFAFRVAMHAASADQVR